MKHDDLLVRKYSCTCIQEIARQSPELAKVIANDNGVKHLVEYISENKGNAALPGIAALGFIAGFDESLAMTVIAAQGIQPLKVLFDFINKLLKNKTNEIIEGCFNKWN